MFPLTVRWPGYTINVLHDYTDRWMFKSLIEVQTGALKICWGASYNPHASCTSKYFRYSKLVMQYIIKLKGHQGEHPVKLVLKNALEWGGEKRKKERFIFKISNEVENL